MKISKIILSIGATLFTTACGVTVDPQEVHKIDEKNAIVDSQESGFDLAGTHFESIGNGSTLTSSVSSLECANNSNDGIRSINSYDLNNKSLEFKITIDRSASGNAQVFKVKSGTHTLEMYTFEYGSLRQLKAGVNGLLAHRDFPADTMEVKVDLNSNTATVSSKVNGSWSPFASLPYSGSNSVSLEYMCGGGKGSTIADLYTDGSLQDLSLSGANPPPPPPPSGDDEYQAEEGTLNAASIATNHGGTGSGFVDFHNSTGSVTWNVNLPAGEYQATVHYGNGSPRRVALKLNGNEVTQFPLAVQGQANWAVWVSETQTITFNNSINTISIDANGYSGGPNLDKIEFVRIGGQEPPPSQSPSVLQAEDNTTLVKAAAQNPYGNSNGGFVDYRGYNASVTWNGLNYEAGTYKIKVRYGNNAHRRSKLIVNGNDTGIVIQFRYDTSQAPRTWANWVTETTDEFTVSEPISSIKINSSNLSGGPNLDQIEVIAVDGSSGGGQGGSGSITSSPYYSYVQKADAFFESQKKVQTHYHSNGVDIPLDSGLPFTNYTLNTYNVPSGNVFHRVSDVYDNGLTAIYYTVTGRASKAGEILSTYLRMYKSAEEYGNSVNKEIKLLTQRVFSKTLFPNFLEPAAEDLGNNSYMAIAFCRYFNQYRGNGASEANLLPYYDRAYQILDYIYRTRLQNNGIRRFIGRDTAGYASAEHHVNLYALGKCMQQYIPAGQGYSTSRITDFTTVADDFVRAMWDNNVGSYRIGTIDDINSSAINTPDRFPADMASWRYMSGAGFRSTGDDTRSLTWLTTPESANGEGGVWVQENFNGINPYYGVRFTNKADAYGTQTENTGAALLALKMHGGFSAKATLIENSLTALFTQEGNGGLPAHDDAVGSSCPHFTDPSCNTGLTWSYFNTPHTASTAYSILGLLGENPYQTEPSGYDRIESVVIPVFE
ncbi:MAG: hypothetical protein AB8G05_07465 [Oligoflexales bacterium]